MASVKKPETAHKPMHAAPPVQQQCDAFRPWRDDLAPTHHPGIVHATMALFLPMRMGYVQSSFAAAERFRPTTYTSAMISVIRVLMKVSTRLNTAEQRRDGRTSESAVSVFLEEIHFRDGQIAGYVLWLLVAQRVSMPPAVKEEFDSEAFMRCLIETLTTTEGESPAVFTEALDVIDTANPGIKAPNYARGAYLGADSKQHPFWRLTQSRRFARLRPSVAAQIDPAQMASTYCRIDPGIGDLVFVPVNPALMFRVPNIEWAQLRITPFPNAMIYSLCRPKMVQLTNASTAEPTVVREVAVIDDGVLKFNRVILKELLPEEIPIVVFGRPTFASIKRLLSLRAVDEKMRLHEEELKRFHVVMHSLSSDSSPPSYRKACEMVCGATLGDFIEPQHGEVLDLRAHFPGLKRMPGINTLLMQTARLRTRNLPFLRVGLLCTFASWLGLLSPELINAMMLCFVIWGPKSTGKSYELDVIFEQLESEEMMISIAKKTPSSSFARLTDQVHRFQFVGKTCLVHEVQVADVNNSSALSRVSKTERPEKMKRVAWDGGELTVTAGIREPTVSLGATNQLSARRSMDITAPDVAASASRELMVPLALSRTAVAIRQRQSVRRVFEDEASQLLNAAMQLHSVMMTAGVIPDHGLKATASMAYDTMMNILINTVNDSTVLVEDTRVQKTQGEALCIAVASRTNIERHFEPVGKANTVQVDGEEQPVIADGGDDTLIDGDEAVPMEEEGGGGSQEEAEDEQESEAVRDAEASDMELFSQMMTCVHEVRALVSQCASEGVTTSPGLVEAIGRYNKAREKFTRPRWAFHTSNRASLFTILSCPPPVVQRWMAAAVFLAFEPAFVPIHFQVGARLLIMFTRACASVRPSGAKENFDLNMPRRYITADFVRAARTAEIEVPTSMPLRQPDYSQATPDTRAVLTVAEVPRQAARDTHDNDEYVTITVHCFSPGRNLVNQTTNDLEVQMATTLEVFEEAIYNQLSNSAKADERASVRDEAYAAIFYRAFAQHVIDMHIMTVTYSDTMRDAPQLNVNVSALGRMACIRHVMEDIVLATLGPDEAMLMPERANYLDRNPVMVGRDKPVRLYYKNPIVPLPHLYREHALKRASGCACLKELDFAQDHLLLLPEQARAVLQCVEEVFL